MSFRIREDLRESRRAGPSTETEPERDQKFHERMRLLAQELAAGLPVLWELASVGIWGALEACMEDLAAAWLLNHRATLAHPDLAKLKLRIPLTEFELLDAEGRMRLLLRIIKTEFSISDDVDGYERIFGLFAMGSAIRGDLRRTLIELCEVRNVLLHRAGYVDERLLRECPWLGLSTGHRILIRRADYERYRNPAHLMAFRRLVCARCARTSPPTPHGYAPERSRRRASPTRSRLLWPRHDLPET